MAINQSAVYSGRWGLFYFILSFILFYYIVNLVFVANMMGGMIGMA